MTGFRTARWPAVGHTEVAAEKLLGEVLTRQILGSGISLRMLGVVPGVCAIVAHQLVLLSVETSVEVACFVIGNNAGYF